MQNKPVKSGYNGNATNNSLGGATATGGVALTTGVKQMLTVNQQLHTAISAQNTKEVRVTAAKLEPLWSSFENRVKPRFPQLYADVESSLDPLSAGAKQSAPDFAALAQFSSRLKAALQQIQQQAGM